MKKVFSILLASILLGVVFAGMSFADRLLVIPQGTTFGIGVKAEYLGRMDGDGNAVLLNVGLPKIEIEGASFNNFNGGADKANVISAQLSIIPETSFTPAVSVGMRDIADDSTSDNSFYGGRSLYIAASKKIPITGGVPVLFEDMSVHGGFGTDSLKGIFFGVEGTLPMGLRLSAEYDSKKVNAGLSYKVIPTLRVDVASIKSDMYYGAKFSTKF